MRSLVSSLGILFFCVFVTGCSPEVGSDEWCAAMKEKPKGEWSANELRDYTKHCILK